jgi:TonB family protein
MRRLGEEGRLAIALAASFALHAGLAFLPYLGTTAIGTFRADSGPHSSMSVNLLTIAATPLATPASEQAAPEARKRPADLSPTVAEDTAEPVDVPALGSDFAPFPSQSYFSVEQLTRRPVPTSEPQLTPPSLRRFRSSGTVVLMVGINELGHVAAVKVERSNLPPVFNEAAATAFQQLAFVPGEIEGRRVPTVVAFEVTYTNGLPEAGERRAGTRRRAALRSSPQPDG